MSRHHDPEVCSIDPATACTECSAAWVQWSDRAAPGEPESLADYRLIGELGLDRLPCQLDRQARNHLLQQLLDLERTVRYYPDWGRRVVTVLRKILESHE